MPARGNGRAQDVQAAYGSGDARSRVSHGDQSTGVSIAFLARARIVVCSKQPEALFVVVEVHGIKHCANPTKEWPCGFCTGIHFAACAYRYLVLRLSLDSSHFGIGAQIHIRTGSTSRS